MGSAQWGMLCALAAMAIQGKVDWRLNGLGLLQAYVAEGPLKELRIHVWAPELAHEGIRESGNIHDHRFNMTSHVLVGAVQHNWVERVGVSVGQHYHTCDVVNARKAKETFGSFDSEVVQHDGGTAAVFHNNRIVAGQLYRFPKREFHESYSDQLTVTLVRKTSQDNDKPARIMWPTDKKLVHAFAPSNKPFAHVLDLAMYRLLSAWEEHG